MSINSPNNNPYAAYKQSSVETATPDKLLLMLFNGGIKFLRQAETALSVQDYTEADKYLVKVQDILSELMMTLDMEKGGQIAQNLYQLYDFYRRQTLTANLRKDSALLPPVLEFFQEFRDTWAEAAKKAKMGA